MLKRSPIPLLLLTVLIGCQSSDQPPLVPVSGVVSLDGKPLEGVSLQFSPVAGGRPSFGMTEANGMYELIYVREEKGATPGQHDVTLMKEGPAPGVTEEDMADGEFPTVEIIPEKYFGEEAIQVTVAGNTQVINFELTSD
ncbi:hypothetical protein V22_39390 [Calycomorphotria hydatis]|uniref:Carboxypeptidase regulatory-like domain-containing protein n=2 Tax=Calycomorphotria hydatis TaxID=2528027 RepID=A0A517TE70_9PLAN|nr:hypothetical protein V22_39390 [Calycomorphotria hydatis]